MNLLLILKALVSILGVAQAIKLLRDWKFHDKRTKEYRKLTKIVLFLMVCAPVLLILLLWIEPTIQRRVEGIQRKSMKPLVDLKLREASESNIVVELLAPNTNASPIQDLFYKFDIPGEFISAEIQSKQGVERCEVSESHLASIGKEDGGWEVIAQTIHIHCRSIFPGGYVRVVTKYSPTRPRPVPGSGALGYTNEITMPLMDLRDYTRCLYSWLFRGSAELECNYVVLTNLAYIANDNTNLLWFRRGAGFYERVGITNSDPRVYDDKWLQEYERNRRDW
jgi:hypothetical protein